MAQATLTEDHCWRGKRYPAGDREIPEELAIALGVIEPPSVTSIFSTPDPAADLVKVAAATEATKPRRKGA